jgi:hypothetical protein
VSQRPEIDVGSYLMVYSGFRFVQMAARAGIPVAAVNPGRTRADEMLALKVEEACETALSFLLHCARAIPAMSTRCGFLEFERYDGPQWV